MRRFDVVIIGAGLAGLQCAQQLAARDISVLIVDRKTDLTRAVHTTGIFVRRTFEDFRFPPSLLGPPVRHVTLHSPAGRQQTLESPNDEFRVGKMGALYVAMLKEAERAGVESLTGAHYRGVERTGGRSDRRGSERTGERIGDRLVVSLEIDGRPVSVGASYLVGADGAVSRVAATLGLSTNTEHIIGAEEVFHDVPLDGPPTLHCYLDPVLAPGYIAWVAHDGHETHLGVGGYAERFSPTEALATLRSRVARDFDLSKGRLVERRGGRIPVGGVLPNISCSSGLLLGDAAGAVSPLTAGGLDGAMRLSRYAAEVLAAAVERDDPSLLALYDGRKLDRRFVSRRWKRRVISMVRSRGLVEVGCALLRMPAVSLIAQQTFFGRGSFPEPDRVGLLASAETTWLSKSSARNGA